MLFPLLPWLTLLAAVGCGLIAGVFFGFSTFIMRALDRLPTQGAVAAMQSVNVVVITPLFLIPFFGTGVVAVLAALAGHSQPQFPTLVTAASLYIFGTLAVTIVGNVPLNNQLARLDPNSAEALAVWRHYFSRWLFWNHVRTAAALLACAVLIWSRR